MNWGKTLAYLFVGAVVPTVGSWAQATVTGQHVPFTAGNVLIPAIPSIMATMMALFSKQPHQDGK